MICDPLPDTGLDAAVAFLLVLAIACLVAGTATLLLARRRGGRASAVLVSLLAVSTLTALLTLGTEAPAQSATAGCTSADDHLRVTQTSTMTGLAPGIAPVPIAGRLLNNSGDSTHIAAVEVSITSITLRPGSSAGACAASDYRLTGARMRVGQTLRPGGSTAFAGATIGFLDLSSNQDACQGATIQLLYTANPE